MFSPKHVLTLGEKDVWHNCPNQPSTTNYWLTNNKARGEAASFVMSFACQVFISGFLIKNTHNDCHHDRGTKNFRIFHSYNSANGPWFEVLAGTLPDARRVKNVPTMSFALRFPVPTQFIKFQIESYYGFGGGLQYFFVY